MNATGRESFLKKVNFSSPYTCMAIVILVYVFKVVFKLWVGKSIGSLSMQSDGYHNMVDILEAVIILFAIYLSNRPATKSFPMGLASVENIVSLEIGILISIMGLSFLMRSVTGLLNGFGIEFHLPLFPSQWFELRERLTPDSSRFFVSGLLVSIISIALSVIISRYQINLGKSINSPGLISDGKESLSDSLTESSVLVGVVGQIFGLYFLDYIAGIFVAGFILHTGWQLIINAVKVLLNVSVEKEKIDAIKQRIRKVRAVKDVEKVYGYTIGKNVTVVCELVVYENISFGALHHIRAPLETEIQKIVPEIDRVYLSFVPVARVYKRYMIGIHKDRGAKSIIAGNFLKAKFFVLIDSVNQRISKTSIYRNNFESPILLEEFIVRKKVDSIFIPSESKLPFVSPNDFNVQRTSALIVEELFQVE